MSNAGNIGHVSTRSPAPAPLDLVQDLVNTWFGHLAGGGDERLRSPADLARWCREHGALVPDEAIT
jgi:hypothetical protein